jgi:hypothetical protein
MALHYRFVACECLGASGHMVQIPPGIWSVAERDAVFAMVGTQTLALNVPAFEQLKRQGKAVPLS